MAFVNEYVSEEDKVKSGIRDLVKHYYEKDHMEFDKHDDKWIHWCVDKEREIWFSHMVSMHADDHREGFTGEQFYILYYQGKNIEIALKRLDGSLKATDNPFYVNWKLLRINKEDIKEFTYEEVLSVLREALDTYGRDGIVTDEIIPQKNQIVTLEA